MQKPDKDGDGGDDEQLPFILPEVVVHFCPRAMKLVQLLIEFARGDGFTPPKKEIGEGLRGEQQ